jgi:hypothetical protein
MAETTFLPKIWVKPHYRKIQPKPYYLPYYIKVKGHYRKIPTKKVWRLTLVINFMVTHKYYGIKTQAWNLNRQGLQDQEQDLKEELVKALEDYLHYKRDEWWFDARIGIGYQQIPAKDVPKIPLKEGPEVEQKR